MKNKLSQYLELAGSLNVQYADIRYEDIQSQEIRVRNESVDANRTSTHIGYGVRVLKQGAWGFSSSDTLHPKSIEETVKQAVQMAEISAKVSSQNIQLAAVPVVEDFVPSVAKIDPFHVSLDEKIDLLKHSSSLMKIPSVFLREASMSFRKIHKFFLSTEGSFIEQIRHETGCGITAYAKGDQGDMQNRSYPNAFGGDYSTYGFEFVQQTDLPGHALQCAQEAVALSNAPLCPSGTKDIIIMGNQMALQIHESIGHPSELDRVLGSEAAYAGTSYMTLDKKNISQIASTIVDITADATVPGSFGYFGYDDEGVKAQKVYLLKSGVLVGYLNSRETAFITGDTPMGAMRADGYWNYPLIRMTSINLLPGNQSLEEMVRDIDDGILFDGIKSWSIDDRRLNFQFGTQYGRIIRKGQLQEVVKNPTYVGESPSFWNSCDAIGDESQYHIYGVPNCGKGEPGQLMKLSHGASPARFRNRKVGVIQ
jgi:TldD protein